MGSWQIVGISIDPSYELAQDDAVAENVAPLVVIFSVQTLGRYPVRGADNGQFGFLLRIGNVSGETEIADDGSDFATVEVFDENVLEKIRKFK